MELHLGLTVTFAVVGLLVSSAHGAKHYKDEGSPDALAAAAKFDYETMSSESSGSGSYGSSSQPSNAPAGVSLRDCLCQCRSDQWASFNGVNGNCNQPFNGIFWCYVDGGENSPCPDLQPGLTRPDLLWSAHACITPPAFSRVCRRLIAQSGGLGGLGGGGGGGGIGPIRPRIIIPPPKPKVIVNPKPRNKVVVVVTSNSGGSGSGSGSHGFGSSGSGSHGFGSSGNSGSGLGHGYVPQPSNGNSNGNNNAFAGVIGDQEDYPSNFGAGVFGGDYGGDDAYPA